MNITDPQIDNYIRALSGQNDAVLAEMEKYAGEKNFPIIGPLVGPFLRQLAFMLGARSIFEMGSGYGYSAYWFAGGMRPGGRIICTDHSNENRSIALDYLKRGGFESLIDFKIGNAIEIISQYAGPFDIIFNDIDKKDYPLALELAIPRLRSGGIFITDNALWSGRILNKDADSATKAILDFNGQLFKRKDILSSIIPIRDGLALAVKI